MGYHAHMLRRSSIVLACTLAVLSSVVLTGQVREGVIAGTVRDETGAPLAGVTIEARSPALAEVVRTTVTHEGGAYRLLALPVGTYELRFSLPYYFVEGRTGIVVTAGETPVRTDVTLSFGAEDIVTMTHGGGASREFLDALAALPACAGDRATPSDWQQTPFRGFQLTLPPGMRGEAGLAEAALSRVWSDDRRLSVSLHVGGFIPDSMASWTGARCRDEIDGQMAVVIEGMTPRTGLSYVVGWAPQLRLPAPEPYGALVIARSPQAEDVPLLRSIVRSVALSR